ncbi:hypothetical protein CERZMDRAFT_99992 [Cercospora zeae-maydis SCOH1-5]|uniref:Uncharacterized protein n=1 Tax=Cercospora zeae-maydis SCOH1-5 TaxID=717836 RepID=A0A6A6F972_9PEZI|nr:hypothetical protein CERZMDRAFT_99992 [Cercospora zeae-maydis SCOH1-5]
MTGDSEISAANLASVAEAALMSPRGPPSSVGASELGRLALGRPGSRDNEMVVTTRSGAKREAASKGEKARGSTGPSKGKGKGQEKASSSKTTRNSGRTSKSTAAPDGPDDDDDDSESSDDSDDDGDVDLHFKRLVLIYEPSYHSLGEFLAPELTGRSQKSTTWRAIQFLHARKHKTQADLAPFMAVAPVEGRVWSDIMAGNMLQRWHSIHDKYRWYISGDARGTDAEGTIQSIRLLLHAVEDTFRHFPRMPDSAKQRLGDIFLDVFQTVARYQTDARPSNAPSYAGGSQQFEYKLLFRFAALKEHWLQCLQVLRRLSSLGYGGLFQVRQGSWVRVHREMYVALGSAGWPRDSGEFITVLQRSLMDLGAVIPPIPTS